MPLQCWFVLAVFVWLALADAADWLEENFVDWHNR